MSLPTLLLQKRGNKSHFDVYFTPLMLCWKAAEGGRSMHVLLDGERDTAKIWGFALLPSHSSLKAFTIPGLPSTKDQDLPLTNHPTIEMFRISSGQCRIAGKLIENCFHYL